MTDEALRSRLQMLRAEGVTYYEDGALKVAFGVAPRVPVRDGDAPITDLEKRASAPKPTVDERLFNNLPGFERGEKK